MTRTGVLHDGLCGAPQHVMEKRNTIGWPAPLHVVVRLTLLVLLTTCHGQLKSIGESMTPRGEKERQWLAHE
jgi:hypothetical protein